MASAPEVPRSVEIEPAPAPVLEQQRHQGTAMNERPADTHARAFADRRASVPSPAHGPPPANADMQLPDPVLPSTPVPQAPTALRSVPSVSESRPAEVATAVPAPAAATPVAATPAAAAPEPPSLAESVTQSTETSERTPARRLESARNPVIVSANRISRWRIGTAGVVHHSTDGGATWKTYSTDVNVPMTAGASPSRAVCWLVGPGGVVLITTDEGRSWQRVPFPVAVDLVSIHAVDDKTARVMTADGRTFSTSDRGGAWTR
jgi:hypothetical protein